MSITLRRLFVLAGICAAGSACAQSNVTLYGLLDIGVVHDGGQPNGGSITKLSSGIWNGSRWGLRGREDLGNGLAAIFTIESGFQADTGVSGQGALFGRQAFVGLAGNFGAVKLGRQYSSIDATVAVTDPFGAGGAGRNVSLVTAAYINSAKSFYNNRINNSVVYTSPTVGGFSGEVGYGFGEVQGNNSAGRYMGASVGYAAGPVYVRLAHQDTNDATATGGQRHTILGASYNFNVLTAYFQYVQNQYEASNAVTAKSRDMLLGVSVPVTTNGRVLASVIRKDDRLAANQDATMTALGYMHDLSKRTTVFTSWGRISNKNGAFYTVNQSIDQGTGNRSMNVGIRHAF